jgi:hypothetical protein
MTPRVVHRPSEVGASMIEFALILPVVMMIIFATITGGIAMSHDLNISHAAREATRYGATLPDNQFAAGDGTDWAIAVANDARDRASGDLGATGATICVALVTGSPGTVYSPAGGSAYFYSSGGGAAAPCFTDGGTDANRRVQVLLTFPARIEAVAYTQTFTITQRADARFEF